MSAQQVHRPHPTLLVIRKAMEDANGPIGPDDAPYPVSLTPIARAVLAAVADEIRTTWGEFADEDLEDAATRISAWLREVASS